MSHARAQKLTQIHTEVLWSGKGLQLCTSPTSFTLHNTNNAGRTCTGKKHTQSQIRGDEGRGWKGVSCFNEAGSKRGINVFLYRAIKCRALHRTSLIVCVFFSHPLLNLPPQLISLLCGCTESWARPSKQSRMSKKTEMAPVQRRQPQAYPGLTVNQWPRSYLVHLAGDPLMALAERSKWQYMPKM